MRAPLRRYPFHILQDRSGQYIPITAMVLLTCTLLTIVALNVYTISKAKLQTQNLADAAALAVASMEAKAVNTVVDRNEWMNNMYQKGTSDNSDRVPNISEAATRAANGSPYDMKTQEKAQAYAQLIATVNRAQQMFIEAYNNFIGAGQGMSTNGMGAAALADILSEIDGLQDPTILHVWVYNTDNGRPDLSAAANTMPTSLSVGLGSKLTADGMLPLKFETANVMVKVKKDQKSLGSLAGQDKTGWMYPVWTDNQMQVQVTKDGGTERHWGVGVGIAKLVPLHLFGVKVVTAASTAYVVDAAGEATAPNSSVNNPAVPANKHFLPTFYAKLAYHP